MSAMSSFLALLLLSIMTNVSSSDGSVDEEVLLRRILLSSPTAMPTQNPVAEGCIVSHGEGTVPSMGLITGSDGENKIDFESGDTNLDADNAKTFCETKFGTGSVPVTPDDEETYDAMAALCEAMGNGHECYMGLYREDYNDGQTDCETWRGEQSGFTLSSNAVDAYGNGWANNHPSCPWLDTSHTRYSSNVNQHCVSYRTNTNNLRIIPCLWQVTIICTYDGSTCNPSA